MPGMAMAPGELAGLTGLAADADPTPQHLCALLEASLVPNGEVQKKVLQTMQQFSKRPSFTKALVWVFAESEAAVHIRQSAGICLKNKLKQDQDNLDESALCGPVTGLYYCLQ